MSKSIIDENKVCHVCGVTQNLERHHVFSEWQTAARPRRMDCGSGFAMSATEEDSESMGMMAVI